MFITPGTLTDNADEGDLEELNYHKVDKVYYHVQEGDGNDIGP